MDPDGDKWALIFQGNLSKTALGLGRYKHSGCSGLEDMKFRNELRGRGGQHANSSTLCGYPDVRR